MQAHNLESTGDAMSRPFFSLKKGLLLSLICSIFIAPSSFASTSILFGIPHQAGLQATEYEVVLLTAPAPLTDSEGRGIGAGQSAGTGRIPGSTYPTDTHAVVWNPCTTVGVDLHPTDFRFSAAYDTNGTQQVGSGNGPPTNFLRHALLWNGSASSYIDLHPTTGNWTDSVAQAIAGNQQVGNINFYDQGNESSPQSIVHAALWRGTAASVVDLHPTALSGCTRSYGMDTDGSRQVGHCFYSSVSTTSPYRALLWAGTAASAVVLHPSGFTHSFAEGVSGSEQVGYAFNTLQGDGYSRALLWRGTAASVVSLHPAGYLATTAYATNGTNQIGSGGPPDYPYANHALRWSGTANSVVDLHVLLPVEFRDGNSIAYDIDAGGNIVGLAQRPDGSTVGILWRKTSSTPLPTATRTSAPSATRTPTSAATVTRTPTLVRTATRTPISASTATQTPASSFPNLLGNPGFELDANNDGRPDTWTTNSKFTRSNTLVFGGSYAGKFAATDNSGVTIQQTVKIPAAGVPYTFSARVNIPLSSDTFTFKIQVRWRDASNNVISTGTIKTYTASTNGWDQAAAGLTAPAGTTNALVVMVVSSLNRTIYVDAFAFKR
jgi:hypothetical protein